MVVSNGCIKGPCKIWHDVYETIKFLINVITNDHEHLGAIEVDAIYDHTPKDMNDSKQKPYMKWTDEERFFTVSLSGHFLLSTLFHFLVS